MNEANISKNYIVGGITWTFPGLFRTLPTINVAIVLKNLIDNIFPVSIKIISVSTSYVVIKVYKSVLDVNNDVVFSECETNDVILQITARV